MAQQRRSLSVVMAAVLLTTLLAPVGLAAAPGGPEPAAAPLLAQDDVSIDLRLGEDLGNGGQPEGYPREIVVDDGHYLFDRLVPDLSEDLTRLGEAEGFTIHAAEDADTLARIYLLPQDGGQMARYLPEHLEAPGTACLAEGQAVGRFEAEGTPYVFAGIEPDLTPDDLQQVGTSGELAVYADPDTAPPFPELFLEDPEGLLRFVALVGDGRPASLAESLALAGTTFPFGGDVTGEVDPEALGKVACAGPFAVYTAPDGEAGDEPALYVIAGNQVLQFEGTLPQAEGVASTPAGTPDAVASPGTAIASPELTPAATPTVEPTPTIEPTATLEPTATEEPTATIEPTSTEAPTATAEATATPTEEAVAAETAEGATDGTATLAPTVPAPEATTAPAGTPDSTATPQTAAAAGLPEQIEVQNTAYTFQAIATDVDIATLVEVETVTVAEVSVTVYALQEVQGVAPQLFGLTADGQVIGIYVPAAATQPAPPAELPRFVEIAGNSYLFNETEVTIDVQTLTVVQTIVVQNIEITIYVEQGAPEQPIRVYLVTADGQVAGQYVISSVVAASAPPAPTPEPTEPPEPAAMVPTLAPDVPPPAVATVVPTTCAGTPGAINAQGLPDNLPNRVQLGGTPYTFVRAENLADAGQLTRIGCAGPFEVASTDQADIGQVLYLRVSGQADPATQVYRFEAATAFQVQIERTERPQVLTAVDKRYRLTQVWTPGLYSSTSVLLFVADPENPAPEAIYAVDVHNTVVGEVIAEYRLPGELTEPDEALATAAQQAGINPDLTVSGTRYILVALYYPAGTSANGFLTLFSATPDGPADLLLGRDTRFRELYIYEREG